jgi:hypothetical protein
MVFSHSCSLSYPWSSVSLYACKIFIHSRIFTCTYFLYVMLYLSIFLYFYDFFYILLSFWLTYGPKEWMYVCMYVCMYACKYGMHVCMYVLMYAFIHTGMHVRMYMYVWRSCKVAEYCSLTFLCELFFTPRKELKMYHIISCIPKIKYSIYLREIWQQLIKKFSGASNLPRHVVAIYRWENILLKKNSSNVS